MSKQDDLIRKGKLLELKDLAREREVQLRAKTESISLALNEWMVDSLADLKVEEAYILAKDMKLLHADYLEILRKIKELEG